MTFHAVCSRRRLPEQGRASSERGLGKFVCSCGAFAVTTVTGLPTISCQSLLPSLAGRNCDLWPLIGR